jgi:hypothetical protein
VIPEGGPGAALAEQQQGRGFDDFLSDQPHGDTAFTGTKWYHHIVLISDNCVLIINPSFRLTDTVL